MRVVLDTCILYSALRSKDGASHRIISQLGSGLYIPIISAPVFFEYEDVLTRPNQFPHLTSEDIADFLDYFASVCEQSKVSYLWRPFLTDPDDDLFLEVAVAANASAIVTYNTRHFAGAETFRISILAPKDFIKEARL